MAQNYAALNILRWRVAVHYRTDQGFNVVEHDIEEIEDLHLLIERGPSFYAIDRIVITPADPLGIGHLTVEGAETL